MSKWFQMTSRLRKRARLARKPSSKNWFDLPAEMRMMVIDRMGAKTRCKFARCSKTCEKEAKMSKKYLTGIEVNRRKNAEILIGHGNNDFYNYCLEFIDVEDLSKAQSIVAYKTEPKFYSSNVSSMTPRILKWIKIEEGNAEDVRLKYLVRLFEKYGKAITDFQINDVDFPFDKFNIKNFTNLKNIGGKLNADVLVNGLVGLNQLMRANDVDLEGTKLSFDQIVQFEGSELIIQSDEFSEENIVKYLKMWKNGEVNRNLKRVEVYHAAPKILNFRNISQGLNVYDCEDLSDAGSFSFPLNYKRGEKSYGYFSYWSECVTVSIQEESTSEDESEIDLYWDSDV